MTAFHHACGQTVLTVSVLHARDTEVVLAEPQPDPTGNLSLRRWRGGWDGRPRHPRRARQPRLDPPPHPRLPHPRGDTVKTRPKDIGTAGETAVVRYLVPNGFPNAERRALHGTTDRGDITGTPGVVWEVKAGDRARDASDNLITSWLGETERERHHDNAVLGVLVVARRRKATADWWAVLWADQLAWLLTAHGLLRSSTAHDVPVRMTLREVVVLLRENGWGDPLDQDQEVAA